MSNASTITMRLAVLAAARLCASACSSGSGSTAAPQATSATAASSPAGAAPAGTETPPPGGNPGTTHQRPFPARPGDREGLPGHIRALRVLPARHRSGGAPRRPGRGRQRGSVAHGHQLVPVAEVTVLRARELYRFYRAGDEETLALRGVSLAVPGGKLITVAGPSGSGKSTLLACLAGLD